MKIMQSRTHQTTVVAEFTPKEVFEMLVDAVAKEAKISQKANLDGFQPRGRRNGVTAQVRTLTNGHHKVFIEVNHEFTPDDAIAEEEKAS